MRRTDTVQFSFKEVDATDKVVVSTVALLHQQLLDWGIAQLGILFLKHVCYTKLIRDGLLKATLCQVNGKPAGFVTYTDKAMTFQRTALNKHWLFVSLLLVVSIFSKPRIIFRLIKEIRMIQYRKIRGESSENYSAEILAIGVLPEYRDPKFIYETRLRISQQLIRYAASYFRKIGFKKMHLLVDAFNKPALFLYQSMGGRLEPREYTEDPLFRVWFDLDRDT